MAKHKTESCTIVWKDSAGIEQASSLKSELFEAFTKEKKICLDLSNVTDIDTSAIQIILAAQKEGEKRGVSFSVINTIPPNISSIIKLLNLELPLEKGEETVHA